MILFSMGLSQKYKQYVHDGSSFLQYSQHIQHAISNVLHLSMFKRSVSLYVVAKYDKKQWLDIKQPEFGCQYCCIVHLILMVTYIQFLVSNSSLVEQTSDILTG